MIAYFYFLLTDIAYLTVFSGSFILLSTHPIDLAEPWGMG